MHRSRMSVARPASLFAILALLASALVLAAPVAADATLTADLTGAAEVCDPVDSCNDPDGSGTATVDITTDTGEICIDMMWDISDGTATAAHIHEAPVGVAGGVVLPIFTDPNDTGMFQGCFTDMTLAAEIEAAPADYYINVHSATYPNGAVRGQLAVAGGGPATGMLMIMKHYCNADDSNPETTVDVRSEEEFMAVEAGGGGDPVVAVALTILACPVERLPGDEPVADTIAHFEEEFDFLVTDATGATFTLADAAFTQAHACEQDRASGPIVIGEVDGDAGTNVCVDFSFYAIDGVAEGEVTVTETFHEGEHEFGTVRFTPAELDPDDDAQTLLGFDRETSTVVVDTSLDGDAMTMLHIYNFDTAAAAAEPTPAPTPAALPDTSVEARDGQTSGTPLTIALLAILAATGGVVGLRTVAAKRNG